MALGAGSVVAVVRNKVVLGQLEEFNLVQVKAVVNEGDVEKDQVWANSNGTDPYFDWTPSTLCAVYFRASVEERVGACFMRVFRSLIVLSYAEMARKNLTVVGQIVCVIMIRLSGL